MTKVVFRPETGGEIELQADIGYSLMEVAVRSGVAGIEAECGGACACATCHVIVDPEWIDRLSPMSEQEDAMLEFVTAGRQPTSRLSCQIKIVEGFDGLQVTIPVGQV